MKGRKLHRLHTIPKIAETQKPLRTTKNTQYYGPKNRNSHGSYQIQTTAQLVQSVKNQISNNFVP